MVIATNNLHLIFQVVLSSVLGGILGLEREYHVSSAGIRTYSAIALGACVFGILSIHAGNSTDQGRIAAQVVSGIGFIGGGIIFRTSGRTSGITTAATLWVTTAIGLAVAFQLYFLAVFTTFIIFLLLFFSRFSWWKRLTGKKLTVEDQQEIELNTEK